MHCGNHRAWPSDVSVALAVLFVLHTLLLIRASDIYWHPACDSRQVQLVLPSSNSPLLLVRASDTPAMNHENSGAHGRGTPRNCCFLPRHHRLWDATEGVLRPFLFVKRGRMDIILNYLHALPA